MENPIKMDDLGVPLFLETPTLKCSHFGYLCGSVSKIGHPPPHPHKKIYVSREETYEISLWDAPDFETCQYVLLKVFLRVPPWPSTVSKATPPKFSVAPQKWWLEDYLPVRIRGAGCQWPSIDPMWSVKIRDSHIHPETKWFIFLCLTNYETHTSKKIWCSS